MNRQITGTLAILAMLTLATSVPAQLPTPYGQMAMPAPPHMMPPQMAPAPAGYGQMPPQAAMQQAIIQQAMMRQAMAQQMMPGPMPGMFFPPGPMPFVPAPPARGASAGHSAAPGAPPPATRTAPGSVGMGIGTPLIPTDPGAPPATFLPGAPPLAPTATHALFSSTAEEVTQIVGSSGHHARGDGHHHHFHRAFGSAHQHFPVPQQPGAPYAYPAYPGSGSQGPTPPALGGPGLPAHASGALRPAGARIGAAEPPRLRSLYHEGRRETAAPRHVHHV